MPLRLECARALLRAGADPNYMNAAGGWCGCIHGQRICRTTSRHGRRLRRKEHTRHARARAGDLALFWAIDGGVEMIKLFVDYGADLNARWACLGRVHIRS